MSREYRAGVAPLAGVAFVVLSGIGAGVEGSIPGDSKSATAISAFYRHHRSHVETGTIVLSIGVIFLVFFFGVLRARLRAEPVSEWLGTIGVAGAVLFGLAGASEFSYAYQCAHTATRVSANALQSLNLLANDGLLITAVGIAITMVAFGAAIIRSRLLPRWLGWAAIVIGVISASGVGTEKIADPLSFLWILVTSVLLAVRMIRTPAIAP